MRGDERLVTALTTIAASNVRTNVGVGAPGARDRLQLVRPFHFKLRTHRRLALVIACEQHPSTDPDVERKSAQPQPLASARRGIKDSERRHSAEVISIGHDVEPQRIDPSHGIVELKSRSRGGLRDAESITSISGGLIL